MNRYSSIVDVANTVRFIPNCLHMGYPTANSYVFPWLERVMA